MDKRYLFRGKRVDNGELVVGFYDIITKGEHLSPIQNGHYITTFKKLSNGEIILTGRHEVDPTTVGQCTGLLAAKSYRGNSEEARLVFEEDICKDARGFVFVVAWDDDNSRFIGRGIGKRKDYIRYVGQEPAVDIVGNIHEHPELFGGDPE